MPDLTKREFEIIELLSRDLTYAEIGDTLGIKSGSVKAHTGRMFKRFYAKNRWDLCRIFYPDYGVISHDGYKEIRMTDTFSSLVDDSDYEAVIHFKWSPIQKRGKYYAHRKSSRQDGTEETIYLHRFIMNCNSGVMVDHIDGNGLNCRRGNMRLCTDSQNKMNRPTPPNNTSGHKGVVLERHSGRWIAQIGVSGRIIKLGRFVDIKDAIAAYENGADKYHAEFANFD